MLIVRGDGIGDALACAPLVAALRRAGHGLGAVLSTRNRDAFATRAFDRTHVLERIPWPRHGSTPESRRTALARTRAARYDAALVVSEEMDAYAFARDAGIPRRVGFVTGWAKPFKTLRVRALVTDARTRPASARRAREHEVETIFALGAGLHDEPVPTVDLGRLRPLVLDREPEVRDRVVLQTSAKFARAGLDEAAFVATARALRERFALDVLGDDAAFVARVASASGGRACAGLDVVAWKDAIASARALVTPDGGAAHVAGFAGTPCVDLFPRLATTEADVMRWRPWAAPYRARPFGPRSDAGSLARAIVADVASVAR